MPQRILLIADENAAAHAVAELLKAHGYPLQRVSDLAVTRQQQPDPALYIVDLALLADSPHLAQEWLRDCANSHSACLGYHSTGAADRTQLALLEPLTDILLQPDSATELLTKVSALLTTRKLSRQLSEARKQLNICHRDLEEALQSAAQIQRSLIPKRAPVVAGLEFAWRFMPCKKVGGDLFNVGWLDENTIMVYIVDVSGHGISSAMVTVSVHQSLSSHTGQVVKRPLDQPPYYEVSTPTEVLCELETEYPFERFEEFFTISYLLINPQTGQVRYCNAGHPPPILLRHNGSIERLTHGGTVIGLGHLVDFEQGETQLQPGDRLYLYTDGITEHANRAGQVFGEGRFVQHLQSLADSDLETSCQETLQQLRHFGGDSPPQDDVTLLAIEFTRAQARPS